jgi:hypothetical protein
MKDSGSGIRFNESTIYRSSDKKTQRDVGLNLKPKGLPYKKD